MIFFFLNVRCLFLDLSLPFTALQVLLLGFSQGGNVAYDVALSYPAELAGLIARRTSLRDESELGGHKGLPILHFHGEQVPPGTQSTYQPGCFA